MKKYLTTIAIIFLMGCANFQQKAGNTLVVAQSAAVSARETMLPIVDNFCVQTAEACRQVQDTQCEPLAKCQEFRVDFINALIGLHYAILDANTALAIGDEETTWAAIDRALELIRELRLQMRALGIVG